MKIFEQCCSSVPAESCTKSVGFLTMFFLFTMFYQFKWLMNSNKAAQTLLAFTCIPLTSLKWSFLVRKARHCVDSRLSSDRAPPPPPPSQMISRNVQSNVLSIMHKCLPSVHNRFLFPTDHSQLQHPIHGRIGGSPSSSLWYVTVPGAVSLCGKLSFLCWWKWTCLFQSFEYIISISRSEVSSTLATTMTTCWC